MATLDSRGIIKKLNLMGVKIDALPGGCKFTVEGLEKCFRTFVLHSDIDRYTEITERGSRSVSLRAVVEAVEFSYNLQR
jgi:hypothetical protein